MIKRNVSLWGWETMHRGLKWGAAVVLLVLIAATGQTVAAATLEVTLVSLTSPVRQAAQATLTIKTAPGAGCAATIRFRSVSTSLPARTAGEGGTVTWTWTAGEPGTRTVVVDCALGDQRGQLSLTYVVN